MLLQEIIHTVEEQLKKKHPFALYHLPNHNEIRFFAQQSDANVQVDFKEKGFVFAPFSNRHKTYFIPFAEAEIKVFSTEEFEQESSLGIRQNYHVENQDKVAYLNLLQKSITALKQSKLQKVVLSRQIKVRDVQFSEAFLVHTFQQLVATYPDAFTYVFYHPDEGFWMGATPEQLISTERNWLTTVALAGTQLYNGTTQVTWGNKEDQEQQYVVDAILEVLERNCTRISTSDKYTKKAGNLLHLNTDIKASFELEKLQDIVNELHPTPAVCGLPKEKAREFILQNENYDRRYYTGYLGEINYPNQKQRRQKSRNQEHQVIKQIIPTTQLFVNLRCMHLRENNLDVFVGGGITAESHPESEWQETEHKSKTMLKVL